MLDRSMGRRKMEDYDLICHGTYTSKFKKNIGRYIMQDTYLYRSPALKNYIRYIKSTCTPGEHNNGFT